MDKNSNVGTQYIICECGDNFPNEELLNIHLANDHAGVEVFQCNACSKYFPSNTLLLQHTCNHEKAKDKTPKINIKPANEKKTPPVIKLQKLKRIDSISLIQTLKSYSGLIKLEAAPVAPEPELETFQVVMQEPSVNVKTEVAEAPEEVATEEIYYQCDVCNTIFYTESDFNVHYQTTHAMKVEPTAEEILEDHLVSDHIDNVNVKAEVEADTAYYYECEICHKIFASEEYFNIHYSRVHGGLLTLNEEPEEPEEGEAESEQPETEENNTLVFIQEEEKEEEYVKKETQDYSIEDFSEPPHKAAEQVIYYKCDLCKILYPSEKAYNTHFDKKHGSQSCQPAPTGYKYIEQDLSGEYPRPPPGEDVFCCEFCPKTFSMKRSLQVHRKRVHADRLPDAAPAHAHAHKQPNRSKVCDVCGRAYNSNAALRYHQRRHTGEKPYPCTLCPKRFTMPMFLQIHLRTHTGERPYECPHCPKAFTNKAALIRHDRVHTGIKPYPCPECGKFFTQSNSMKLHVSTVHLKLPAPYKSKNRRDKSEARALQLALKNLPAVDDMDD